MQLEQQQQMLRQQLEQLQLELELLQEQQQERKQACHKQSKPGPTEQRSERNVSLLISFSQWLQ